MQDFVEIGENLVFLAMTIASVIALGVFLERILYYRKSMGKLNDQFLTEVRHALHEKPEVTWEAPLTHTSSYWRFVHFALRQIGMNRKGLDESLEGQIISEKIEFEKRLPILNTLGNNAPFIGLLGTVLGVIKAFYPTVNSCIRACFQATNSNITNADISRLLIYNYIQNGE